MHIFVSTAATSTKGGWDQNEQNIPDLAVFCHTWIFHTAVKIKSISVIAVKNISITPEKD